MRMLGMLGIIREGVLSNGLRCIIDLHWLHNWRHIPALALACGSCIYGGLTLNLLDTLAVQRCIYESAAALHQLPAIIPKLCFPPKANPYS